MVALVAVVAGAEVLGLDPLVNVTTALVGLGSVGLMTLLAVTSLGIPIFFSRKRSWTSGRTLAPLLGGLAISWAVYLAFTNYSLLTGVNSTAINHLPYILVLVGFVGVAQAEWLRRFRPDVYRQIGATHIDEAFGRGRAHGDHGMRLGSESGVIIPTDADVSSLWRTTLDSFTRQESKAFDQYQPHREAGYVF